MADNAKDQTVGLGKQSSSDSGMLGGMAKTVSSVVGGSQSSSDDQSFLSKGIDAVQQSVYGGGNQPGPADDKVGDMGREEQEVHAAVDEAHPEQISEFLRDKYRTRTDEQKKEEAKG